MPVCLGNIMATHPSSETANWFGLDLPQVATITCGKPIPFLTCSPRCYIQAISQHLYSKLGIARAHSVAIKLTGMV